MSRDDSGLSGGADRCAATVACLLAGAADPAAAVVEARRMFCGPGGSPIGAARPETEFRSILRAAGVFARDNDAFFMRVYDPEQALQARDEEVGSAAPGSPGMGFAASPTHVVSFPVPTEPRMRVAYFHLQGLVLKQLYQTRNVVPLSVLSGYALVRSPQPLPGADELWAEFLESPLAAEAMTQAVSGQLVARNVGRVQVEDDYLSRPYLIALAHTIAQRPHLFQWQAGGQVKHFQRKLLPAEHQGVTLLTATTPLRRELRRRGPERDTLDTYEWVERHALELEPVARALEELTALFHDGGVAAGRRPAAVTIDTESAVNAAVDSFLNKQVPVAVSAEAVRKGMAGMLGVAFTWALVSHPKRPSGVAFLDWDLDFLAVAGARLTTARQRGALFFMQKGRVRGGAGRLAALRGPLSGALVRIGPQRVGLGAAPFAVASLDETPVARQSAGPAGCLVCGRPGTLYRAGAQVLPESKKRHYDRPWVREGGTVCAPCVKVSMLSGLMPIGSDYVLLELPVRDSLELFALYEALEGLSALNALRHVMRVGSVTVFPNRYLLLGVRAGPGTLPRLVQLYLQLARHRSFLQLPGLPDQLEAVGAETVRISTVAAAVLSKLKSLPWYYTTERPDKAAAIDMVAALEDGLPYSALRAWVGRLVDRAPDAGGGAMTVSERGLIEGGVEGYDRAVQSYGSRSTAWGGGQVELRKIEWKDVADLSQFLVELIRPLAGAELSRGSRPKLAGVVRKYTDCITALEKDDRGALLYKLAQAAEAGEAARTGGGSVHLLGRLEHQLKALGSGLQEPFTELETRIDKARKKYSSPHFLWRRFLHQVHERTLAVLLLTTRAR